jgi:hypothetical protein
VKYRLIVGRGLFPYKVFEYDDVNTVWDTMALYPKTTRLLQVAHSYGWEFTENVLTGSGSVIIQLLDGSFAENIPTRKDRFKAWRRDIKRRRKEQADDDARVLAFAQSVWDKATKSDRQG